MTAKNNPMVYRLTQIFLMDFKKPFEDWRTHLESTIDAPNMGLDQLPFGIYTLLARFVLVSRYTTCPL